ncbi:MAG TPA: permease prefix domain 1-containing protein [Vicinamibacterales bacterium]|jgi:hypothetical protein
MPVDRWWHIVRLRVRALTRGAALERELDEEISFHVDHLIRGYVKNGLSADDARTAALRDMGWGATLSRPPATSAPIIFR